jgi:hypothetical protein
MGRSAQRRILAAGILVSALSLAKPAMAGGEMTAADLRAVANALGFLNGLPRGAPIMVGVVFGVDNKQAAQTAAELEAIPGPAKSSFKTELLAVKDLSHAQGHLDVALIMPDAAGDAVAVADAARHRKLVTIATDPNCLEQNACVLMVRAGERTKIVLDTQLAAVVGANFSTVFTMMVERK